MSCWVLFWTFFKFGLLCFGGGYMLIPLLTAELVEARHLLTAEAFSTLVSVAQVTPGPVAVNCATYVGFLQQGIPGAVAATAGLAAPSLLLVILAVKLLKRYEATVWVRGFLAGMRPAAWGLIVVAALVFAELSVFTDRFPRTLGDWTDFGIRPAAALVMGAVLYCQLKTRISFHWLLLGAAVIGAFFCQPA